MIGDKIKYCGRYYNANGCAVAIVAVVTEGIDWAVYIGATQPDVPQEETVEWVAKHGCKLSIEDARHYFCGDGEENWTHVRWMISNSLPYRE